MPATSPGSHTRTSRRLLACPYSLPSDSAGGGRILRLQFTGCLVHEGREFTDLPAELSDVIAPLGVDRVELVHELTPAARVQPVDGALQIGLRGLQRRLVIAVELGRIVKVLRRNKCRVGHNRTSF